MATSTPTKTMNAIIENKKSIYLIIDQNYEEIIKNQLSKGSNKKLKDINLLNKIIEIT